MDNSDGLGKTDDVDNSDGERGQQSQDFSTVVHACSESDTKICALSGTALKNKSN